ncbi:hypothetical protein [Nocardioides zeae]
MKSPQDDRPHRIPDAEGQELFQALQRALASGRPLDLLVSVASLLDSIDERSADPGRTLGPGLGDLVLSFVDTPYAETTAALLVLRELHPALPHADRVDAELGRRGDAVPGWLRELGRTRAAGSTWTITEVGGDAVDHLAGVRLPDGSSLTTAVILDRATRGHVLDGVVLPWPSTTSSGRRGPRRVRRSTWSGSARSPGPRPSRGRSTAARRTRPWSRPRGRSAGPSSSGSSGSTPPRPAPDVLPPRRVTRCPRHCGRGRPPHQ